MWLCGNLHGPGASILFILAVLIHFQQIDLFAWENTLESHDYR